MKSRIGSKKSWLLVLASMGAAALATARGVRAEAASGVEADRFRISSCSLGCNVGATQVSCSIVNVTVNHEVRVRFTQPVDLSSVLQNPSSFRLLETSTGTSPAGSFGIDFLDPNTLIFYPQVSFGPLGNPTFGFKTNAAYQILIPGALAGDPGPYVLSVAGLPVETRLLCTVFTSQGVGDYVPGPPTATATVDVVIPSDPGTILLDPSPAAGARNVSLTTDVTLDFDDVMYLGTLITPITGVSSSVFVGRSPDPVADPIPGSFTFVIDIQERSTQLVFRPDQPLPTGEKILIQLDPSITDIAGNALRNPGTIAFRTVDP